MRVASVTFAMLLAASSAAQATDADVADAAERYGLPVSLVEAVVAAESAGDPRAVSPKGAMGLMQLMPATAARFGVEDPFDPWQSLDGGCAYLRWLLDRFDGDVPLALAGYNAGEGSVDRYAGVPPFAETREYVARVLARIAPAGMSRAPVATSLVSLAPAGAATSIVAGAVR